MELENDPLFIKIHNLPSADLIGSVLCSLKAQISFMEERRWGGCLRLHNCAYGPIHGFNLS